eukprot:TRINITY_DN1147_c1_g1_i3.p1 TRINITY_DN1147_c1_g1~~TRINITY_DN1147_c1_g1_i3.p1  ORF type:complete len:1066 (-),score=261.97 TRINITY_DN1147_c1_g1_i3:935-4132(-)
MWNNQRFFSGSFVGTITNMSWKRIGIVYLIFLLLCQENNCNSLDSSHHFNQKASLFPSTFTSISNEPIKKSETAKTRSSSVKNEYIVMFNRFMEIKEHEKILEEVLGKVEENSESPNWKILERNNPNKGVPSDFSLVKFNNGNSKDFVSKLKRNENVKFVFPQRRYRGTLQAFEEEDISEEESGFEKRFPNATQLSSNRVGRGHTKFWVDAESQGYPGMRKTLSGGLITELLNVESMWDQNFTGSGVRVAVFDTGLRKGHSHFKNIVEITNWTNEDKSGDTVGHGTFVAGVIGSSYPECPGLAPDSQLYIFRVFNDEKISYTSWFLDAFNYVLLNKIDILNFSIGGPDFMDRPFVEKVWELSANNVVVVSAVGNDGPLYGTLNNPADQLDVIGVGGLKLDGTLAEFSSRGMTTWEIPEGYGRVKPDVLTFGQNVLGSKSNGDCKRLSGTSVASPVVTGVLSLLISSIPIEERAEKVNVATLKQILVEGAERLEKKTIFEQGFGKVDLARSHALLLRSKPKVTLLPPEADLTQSPYFWPYCSQPLFHGALPIILNTTLLNGMGVIGEVKGVPVWKPNTNGHLLELSFGHSEVFWPWTGYFSISIRVSEEGATFQGDAEGVIEFTVVSPPGEGETEEREQLVRFPLKVNIVPTPPRKQRILWDQYHSLRYPSGYFPRDALEMKEEPFDWNGDHLHTNFKWLWTYFRKRGYYVDILGSPYTCFKAENYGTLMIVDPEEEFFPAEIEKLEVDIKEKGLSVVVFADWYNIETMKNIVFFDQNTRQWWSPATGGSNIPALNSLLSPFGIAFGDKIFGGTITSDDGTDSTSFASGVSIARFPAGGSIVTKKLDDQTNELISRKSTQQKTVPVIGIYPTATPEMFTKIRKNISESLPKGRIAVFGDSSCLDDAYKGSTSCYWLCGDLIRFAMEGTINERFTWDRLDKPYIDAEIPQLPLRMEGADLYKYSKVIGKTAFCPINEFKQFNKSEETIKLVWEDYSVPTNRLDPNKAGHSIHDAKFKEEKSSRKHRTLAGNLLVWLGPVAVIVMVVIAVIIMRRQFRSASQRTRVLC